MEKEMATAKTLYFSGETEISGIHGLDNTKFANAFPGIHGIRFDSFKKLIGYTVDGPKAALPVTRRIFFKANPSLHKCDARCTNAKGGNCECLCGGQNHGVNG